MHKKVFIFPTIHSTTNLDSAHHEGLIHRHQQDKECSRTRSIDRLTEVNRDEHLKLRRGSNRARNNRIRKKRRDGKEKQKETRKGVTESRIRRPAKAVIIPSLPIHPSFHHPSHRFLQLPSNTILQTTRPANNSDNTPITHPSIHHPSSHPSSQQNQSKKEENTHSTTSSPSPLKHMHS
jgi:hypothetical protein